jgi:uncharacterized protein YndB with AHSA1/START domain
VAEYRFLTTWVLDAEPVPVWNAIFDAERWPEWWPGVERVVKVREGDESGVGTVYENLWRSRIPYAVEFEAETVAVRQPHLIEVAARGKLEGTGRWRLFQGGGVAVTYEWNVRTTRRWMNALSPVARPLFAANHDYVMRRGGEGLARLLGARLLAVD